MIPVDAISEDAEGPYVMVQTGSGTTERRSIETGLSDGSVTEVVSGLAAGDVVEYQMPGMDFSNMMGMGGGAVTVSTVEG